MTSADQPGPRGLPIEGGPTGSPALIGPGHGAGRQRINPLAGRAVAKLLSVAMLAATSAALAAPDPAQAGSEHASSDHADSEHAGSARVADGGCNAVTVAAVARHLEAAPGDAQPPVAQACKAWPFDPAVTLAAVAWSRSPPDVATGERALELVVAMLSPRGEVLATHRSDLTEDAALELAAGSLRLDTARYDLAPGRRAFGVVLNSMARGASCPDRGFEDELTLYLREGAQLKPILVTYLRAWDFVEGSPCARDTPLLTDTAQITLHIEPTRSHGLADIRLQAAVARQRNDWSGAPVTPVQRSASRVLRFDGSTYQADPYADLFFWAVEGRRD